MKLDGKPDDLSLSRLTTKIGTFRSGDGSNPTPLTKLYMGGEVRAERIIDMTNAALVVNGNTFVETILEFKVADAPITEWIVTGALLSIKGFTGGSGAVSAKLGTNTPNWDDLIASAVSQVPGGATVTKGIIPGDLGTRIVSAGVPKGALMIPGTDFIKVLIDATAHSGTVTAGTLRVIVFLKPINGYT